MAKLIVIICANHVTWCSVAERARLSRSSSDTRFVPFLIGAALLGKKPTRRSGTAIVDPSTALRTSLAGKTIVFRQDFFYNAGSGMNRTLSNARLLVTLTLFAQVLNTARAGPVEDSQARDAARREDEEWRKRVYGDPTH